MMDGYQFMFLVAVALVPTLFSLFVFVGVLWLANKWHSKLSLQNRHLLESVLGLSEKPSAFTLAGAIEQNETKIASDEIKANARANGAAEHREPRFTQ